MNTNQYENYDQHSSLLENTESGLKSLYNKTVNFVKEHKLVVLVLVLVGLYVLSLYNLSLHRKLESLQDYVVNTFKSMRSEVSPGLAGGFSSTSSMATIAQQMGGFNSSISTNTPTFIKNLF
jgi:hypothetical protein